MRQRWQTSLVLIALIASQNLCSFARQIPPQKHSRSISRQQHEEDQPVATQKDDPFSMSNLIRMGIKVALAVFSSYTNDDIDRIDKVSPTQAILGTVISAVTGSENPQEVAVMAKQATDVINLLVTLVEAVGTSITS